MGNCIGSARALCSTNKKVTPHEDDHEFKAPPPAVVAGKITSTTSELLPLSAFLKSGEVQHSLQVQLGAGDSCKRVKIVVNKKQLQLLKKSLEELKLSHVVIQTIQKKGKKWRPCLATIPEV